jgi:hypothetical protein
MIGGEIAIAPYDSKMNKINLTCKTCGKDEHFRQKMIHILNDMLMYDTYCEDCGIEFLRNWQRGLEGNPEAVTKKNVRDVSELHRADKANEIFASPEKLKKIRESDNFKAMVKDLDLNPEDLGI